MKAEDRLQRVQIVNRKHPHFEEYGRFTGKISLDAIDRAGMEFNVGPQDHQDMVNDCDTVRSAIDDAIVVLQGLR